MVTLLGPHARRKLGVRNLSPVVWGEANAC